MKRKNLEEKVNFSSYYLAKCASKELLVEELVLSKGGDKSYYLEKYIHHPFRLKLKIILTKLFFAVTFGIIPVIPLLTYFEIVNLLSQDPISIEIVYFVGGLLFSLYFCLQFLNFFIMAMMDTVMIVSGKIFEWLETMPISRKKLLRIAYLTLFRSYDLPIIVLIFAFPITMLIGSQNIVLFLVCLGISFVNMVLSFSIMLIFGERINRILDIHDKSSKKNFLIRLINIFSYLFIIISTYFLIQWFFSSIDTFYNLFTASEYQTLINTILSFIIFPFNSSYLISLFIAPNHASLQLWISTLIGFALLIAAAYIASKKSFRAVERIIVTKLKAFNIIKLKKPTPYDAVVRVKPRREFSAHLRIDLLVITRDLKVFMSIILPILLSFIFTFSFGIKNAETISLIDREFFQNWIGILNLSPILSGLIIYGLFSYNNSEESITQTLPIVPRDQAKSKLFLIFIIQTCTILLPSLIYLGSPNFDMIFINFLFALPYSWLFLFVIFVLRIIFFGKKRSKFYVLDDQQPKKRIFKWIMIISIPYILFFWTMSFGITFLYNQENSSMIFLYWVVLIIGFLISFLIFNIILPVYHRYPQTLRNKTAIPTVFSKHVWFSIVILLIIRFLLFFFITLMIAILSSMIAPTYPFTVLSPIEALITSLNTILIMLLPNILYSFMWFQVTPKYIGLPFGKHPFKQHLDYIGLSWLKKLVTKKNLKAILLVTVSFFITFFIAQLVMDVPLLNFYSSSSMVSWLLMLSFCFWQEVVHRGIILTMLLGKYSKKRAIAFQTGITIILKFFINIFIMGLNANSGSYFSYSVTLIILDLISSGVISLILGYVYLKRGSLLPGLISLIIMSLFIPINIFIYFMPTSFFAMSF